MTKREVIIFLVAVAWALMVSRAIDYWDKKPTSVAAKRANQIYNYILYAGDGCKDPHEETFCVSRDGRVLQHACNGFIPELPR